MEILKGPTVGHVEHKADPVATSIVAGSECAVALLAGGVEQVQLNRFPP